MSELYDKLEKIIDLLEQALSELAAEGKTEALKPGPFSQAEVVGSKALISKDDPVAYPDWSKKYAEGEQVTFVPFDFGGWRAKEIDDRKYFEVRINGAYYVLKLNEENTVPAAVFHLYNDAVAHYKEAQSFKRNGPTNAPWSKSYPGNAQKSTWHHEPSAPTHWIDIEGRYINSSKDYILIDENGRPSPDGAPMEVPKGVMLIRGQRK